jgi:hypothetical protein
MKDWFQKQIETGFTDLQGLNIKATVPLKDKVINDALAAFLQSPPEPATSSPGPGLRGLLPLVRRIQLRSTDGVLIVDIEIAV